LKPLILKQKTGFINLNPNRLVVIRDFRGKLFYSTEGLRPVKLFNLPEGQFFIDQGDFIKLDKPVKKKLVQLPKPERHYKPPFDFSIEFGYNENKCTIQWMKKNILFDNSLMEATIPQLWFILCHEFGHALYTTEKYADLFAVNAMLQKGYNESQIGLAPLTVLSTKQIHRKQNVVNKLLGK
jgi:hypothetical protein